VPPELPLPAPLPVPAAGVLLEPPPPLHDANIAARIKMSAPYLRVLDAV
jgi:hypothetical protein